VDTTAGMRLLTATVTFSAQGHDYSVELSTLVTPLASQLTTMNSP
jgi:hypothetical protein